MANGKTMQAVVNLAGSIDPSLGKAIEQAQKKISGLNVKALAVGAAVGGIAVATGKAVVEAGKYMKDLGASFDDAADAIRIGTGATGDALDGLLDDFDAVYKSVPTTMEDASKAIADYNTRLGLTGPQLQTDGLGVSGVPAEGRAQDQEACVPDGRVHQRLPGRFLGQLHRQPAAASSRRWLCPLSAPLLWFP